MKLQQLFEASGGTFPFEAVGSVSGAIYTFTSKSGDYFIGSAVLSSGALLKDRVLASSTYFNLPPKQLPIPFPQGLATAFKLSGAVSAGPTNPQCECGAASIDPSTKLHSSWCPKHDEGGPL